MSIYVCVRSSGPVQCTITLPLLNVRLTERRPDSLLDALGITSWSSKNSVFWNAPASETLGKLSPTPLPEA